MKLQNALLGMLAFAAAFQFTACKKEDKKNENPQVEVTTHTDDQGLFSAEFDAAGYETEQVFDAYLTASSGRNQDAPIDICGASVSLNNQSSPKTISIVYNGDNCSQNRTRTGTIEISFDDNTWWSQKGTEISVKFKDFKIVRKSDKKSVSINGTTVYKNVTGGHLKTLASQATIVHTVHADDLAVVFDNGSKLDWSVAKERSFTYDNGIVLAVKGLYTQGNETNIAEWGTNRLLLPFATSSIQPLVIRQDCDFRVTGGVIKHTVSGITATATFGLDAQGNPVSCPDGSYYAKIVYTGPAGNSISFIAAY